MLRPAQNRVIFFEKNFPAAYYPPRNAVNTGFLKK